MTNRNYQSLSDKYREEGRGQLSKKEVEAYLTARMPATFAAISAVLEEVAKRTTQEIGSTLDLGAGPGTATLAAKEVFPELKEATLFEKNEKMIESKCVEGTWIARDFERVEFADHDLGIFGYSFGELSQKAQLTVLEKVWKACSIVVIVEPGTPRGYENILRARAAMIGWGGQMIGPCPHTDRCPMEGKDWCHFSVRLQRSREHKHAKGGKLGWEDEKYSYIAMSKGEALAAKGRILRHPEKKKGHVILQLCQVDGLEKRVVTKKEKELYRLSRKVVWGDAFPS